MPVVTFSQNGVPQPVSGVPPPILQLIAKWLHLDGPRCIFGQMIFWKIITIVAGRGQISIKFYFDWVCTPDRAAGAYRLSQLEGGEGRERGEDMEGRGGREEM